MTMMRIAMGLIQVSQMMIASARGFFGLAASGRETIRAVAPLSIRQMLILLYLTKPMP
jgi:hypothetical protein